VTARRPLALLMLVALFGFAVLPAAALAQSAGDDQYQDPFAGDNGSENDGGSNGGGNSGDSSGGSGGTPTPAPQPAPAPAAPATPAAPAAESGTTVPTDPAGNTLPRTGRDAEWLVAVGLLLIAAGAGLRRSAPARTRP
jgi:LPXTG-motif cell wall-anchored protein